MASIARRPDGRWRARYRDHTGREHARHFKRKIDAQQWLETAGHPTFRAVRPAPPPPRPPRPHVLYRFLDEDGQLLYVGITVQGAMRWSDHRINAPWWSEVCSVDVQHLASYEDAAAAEARAIKSERPLHNVVHAGRRVPSKVDA